ncbi:hypothetical protein HK405_001317, partial [Cladochytrium tenue]
RIVPSSATGSGGSVVSAAPTRPHLPSPAPSIAGAEFSDTMLQTLLINMTLDSDMYALAEPQAGHTKRAAIRRAGAPASEEVELAERFFVEQVYFISFIHRPSYLKNIATVSSALRLAVCAGGAIIPARNKGWIIPKDDSMWYYETARDLILSDVEHPSLELLQALLVIGQVTR